MVHPHSGRNKKSDALFIQLLFGIFNILQYYIFTILYCFEVRIRFLLRERIRIKTKNKKIDKRTKTYHLSIIWRDQFDCF